MSSKQKSAFVGPPDSNYVGVDEAAELVFWSNRFQVSADKLKAAVSSVGHRFKDVRFFLNRNYKSDS